MADSAGQGGEGGRFSGDFATFLDGLFRLQRGINEQRILGGLKIAVPRLVRRFVSSWQRFLPRFLGSDKRWLLLEPPDKLGGEQRVNASEFFF